MRPTETQLTFFSKKEKNMKHRCETQYPNGYLICIIWKLFLNESNKDQVL